MNPAWLRAIRRYEFDCVRGDISAPATVLELGAGVGWQASWLRECGHDVVAVDVPEANHCEEPVFPITVYDGRTLPCPAQAFTVIFSSNVLEHIADLPTIARELDRVLKPAGYAIHILPTSAWRWWTAIAHYLYLIKAPLALLSAKLFATATAPDIAEVATRIHSRPIMAKLLRALLPVRHGEQGSAFTELFSYTQRNWRRRFAALGWEVVASRSTGIFYSGHAILGSLLGIPLRRRLSWLLGSSTRIYIVRRAGQG